jgi:hypothetical protein
MVSEAAVQIPPGLLVVSIRDKTPEAYSPAVGV